MMGCYLYMEGWSPEESEEKALDYDYEEEVGYL